jgi:6-phosphogluconolactonase
MTRTPTLLVSPDAATLMRDAADRIVALYREATAGHGVFHIALSGGGTPNALYRLLATPAHASQFDWTRMHLWWSDERYLPIDSPDNNYHMAYQALISKIAIPAENVHRVRVELPAEDVAADYESAITRNVGASDAQPPAFDAILLGLGEDGHTASIFPGTVAHIPPDRLVVAHFVPQVAMWRITFTSRLINAARHVLFLVSGKGKAAILERVLHGPYQPDVLPAQLVAPTNGNVTWIVDSDAAGSA